MNIERISREDLTFMVTSIKMNIASMIELRTAFILNLMGMFLNNTVFIIIWWQYSKVVGDINGWTSIDMIGMLGISNLSYGFMIFFFGGLFNFYKYIVSGVVDTYILNPRNTLIRAITARSYSSGAGDLFFGVTLTLLYVVFNNHPGLLSTGIICITSLSAFIIFLAVSIVIASLGFLVQDPTSIISSLSELFLTPGLFHGGSFVGFTRFFFTFIIPSLFIGALPVEAVIYQSLSKTFFQLAVALFWLIGSYVVFYVCLKKYEGSSLMTFGQ